jgi:serine/threonine protein kinase
MSADHTSDPSAMNQTSREQLIASAIADYLDLSARNAHVDPVEFCRRYPPVEEELHALIDTMAGIDGVLEESELPSPADADEPLPDQLSGYRILSVIGSGGMGRVLLARDESLGRYVAVKTLNRYFRDSTRLRDRFMQEARAMARLNHPNIVRIYNLGKADEIPHFVMEHIQGTPLTESARPLTIRQKIELFRKVVIAVEYLHRNGIIHRDLKPANVLVEAGLEPKLLDFGLAQQVDHAQRLTRPGEIMGTPDYFSPEQAAGDSALDARSDVFSLGSILYELLTGAVPFSGDSLQVQVRMIREGDPVLPRRLNVSVPGSLQNVCLKCLEKDPSKRYTSAQELSDDLARYLAGEPVLANPTSYARLLAGKIEQHLQDLRGWESDRLVSPSEFDAFRRLYGRLIEREDAWILEARHLSLTQVVLYLGAWILVAGATLVFLFRYPSLAGTSAVATVSAATLPALWAGVRAWGQMQKRIGVAFLLAFCLLLPSTLLVAMKEWHVFDFFTQGKESLELFARLGISGASGPFRGTTNSQMWWSIALSIPLYVWLRRHTGSSVFSLMLALAGAALSLVTLLRMGMLDWFEQDPGRVYFRLLPFAAVFFVLAASIEKVRHPDDSRYFYPVAVTFIFVSLSGIALFHEPYARWLERTIPATRGQLEYLFIINAVAYLSLQSLSERFGSEQMRAVAKAFRFVIPGHVLTSLLLLGIEATRRWHEAADRMDLRHEARFFEFVLPVAACMFVLGSVPKQMKNFFVTGMLFLGIGIVRLQQDFFRDRASWPVALLVTGLLLMFAAAHYPSLRLMVGGLFRGRLRRRS